jgi:uncharacterized phage protein (TIGR02218 family)
VKTDLSPELEAHYGAETTTLATLWKVTRRDGAVFGFTDHDKAITFEGLSYEASSAYDAAAIQTKSGLQVDQTTLHGILHGSGIDSEDIEEGTWDGAAVEIVEVNWADLSMGANTERVGVLGEVQSEAGRYTAELRGLMHKLTNNIGRIVSPSCDAELGDARCGVNIEALRVSGTVAAVTDRRSFEAPDTETASSPTVAAGYFSYGVATWVTGANAGRSMEVKSHAAGGVFTLQLPMPDEILVGDTFTIVPGCDKTKATCIAKFANVINFRGFSYVPGQDQVLLVGGQ